MAEQRGGAGGGASFERQLDAFMAALKAQESGGDPNATNPRTKAHGLWQIMPSNWGPWSRATFGEVRPQTAENQFLVARKVMTDYYQQFGRWDAVAVAWFAGPGRAERYVNGDMSVLELDDGNLTVREYIEKARAGMAKALGGNDVMQAAAPDGGGNVTAAGVDDIVQADTGGGASVQGIGSVPEVPDAVANLPDDQLVDYLQQNYGYLAWALNNPEVRPILLQIARGQITDPDRIFGQLQSTEWFQSTQASAREWEALAGQDPAEANRRVNQAQSAIRRQAESFGIALPLTRIREIAHDSLKFGWDEMEVRSALFAEAKRFDPGIITATQDALGDLASQYFVPISDQNTEEWAKRIALGETTVEGYESYLRDQATSLFSGNQSVRNALEQGMTVRQWADPYVQIASRTLEVAPGDFDLTNTRWMKGIHQVDPEKGVASPMSLSDWSQYLRSQPEWRTTNQARQQAAQWTEFIAKKMGAA